MNSKTKIMLILFSALLVCVLTSCIKENGGNTMNRNELSNVDKPLSSPSSNYEAVIEKFDDNGVRSYKLFIVAVDDSELKYEADLVFRARDRNYVFWADGEDILWGYSGDVGTYFWAKEDGFWIKSSYAENRDANIPQALRDARP